MGAGKIGAQCGHATLGLYQQIKTWVKHSSYWKRVLSRWTVSGQKKICLKVQS